MHRLSAVVLFALALVLPSLPTSAVTIDWVTVGGAGNADDTTGYGGVATDYRIAKYEVTNAQYAEFLNAVAGTDSYALYNTSMGSGYGGITRSGSSGSYTYSAISGRGNIAVNYVSFFDSARFANWLHNGQLSGAQDSSTTEDGAYTFSGATSISTRNAGANIFLTSQDEWYKAAYYDTGSLSYYDFPAGTDSTILCASPGATANTANCFNAAGGGPTDVGSYTGSSSPNGTFDQGGNLWELVEPTVSGGNPGLRGGAYSHNSYAVKASYLVGSTPTSENINVGFRVASLVPEPGTGLLLSMGMLGIAGRRRRG